MDCDSFFASVEKRDRPELRDRPVIVGGTGQRGVVTAACYIARTYGVKSAMPMARARSLCPEAVIIPPSRNKYSLASKQVFEIMEHITPLVQPVSIDEAFLDLSGTESLHQAPAAVVLAKLAKTIHDEVGISVSIGLAPNKFLAKLASGLDKPLGFSVIGEREKISRLAPLPVRAIYGVGPAFARKLATHNIHTIGDVQKMLPRDLAKAYGEQGYRLARLAQGEDARKVTKGGPTKSISSETTFDQDIMNLQALENHLWHLASKVSASCKRKHLVGRVITLTLKTARFQRLTRRKSLDHPTQLKTRIYQAASGLLRTHLAGADRPEPYRLIGVGVSELSEAAPLEQQSLFPDPDADLKRQEQMIDHLQEKFGSDIIGIGRDWLKRPRQSGKNDKKEP